MRIRDALIAIAAVASLAICAVSIPLWILSWGPLKGDVHGTATAFVRESHLYIGPPFRGGQVPAHWDGFDNGLVGWLRFESADGKRWTTMHFPICFVTIASALLPILYFRPEAVWRRRIRMMRGLCPECGYDLRASADTCPECGRNR